MSIHAHSIAEDREGNSTAPSRLMPTPFPSILPRLSFRRCPSELSEFPRIPAGARRRRDAFHRLPGAGAASASPSLPFRKSSRCAVTSDCSASRMRAPRADPGSARAGRPSSGVWRRRLCPSQARASRAQSSSRSSGVSRFSFCLLSRLPPVAGTSNRPPGTSGAENPRRLDVGSCGRVPRRAGYRAPPSLCRDGACSR